MMIKSSIFLHNRDLYHEMIQYDIGNGNKTILTYNDETKISGLYSRIDGELMMLYKKNNCLYLNVKNTEVSLLDNNLTVTLNRIGKNNEVSINLNKNKLFYLFYQSCIYDPVNSADPDFNSFKEDDQDFFLFLYNILQSKERQKVLLEVWT